MSKKNLSIPDSIKLPAIRRDYRSPVSGFIQKWKTVRSTNAQVYFPQLGKSFREHEFIRNGTPLQIRKAQSLENIQHNGPVDLVTDFSVKTLPQWNHRSGNLMKEMSVFLPDLPAILEQETWSAPEGKIDYLDISKSKRLSANRCFAKGIFPHMDHANSMYKFDNGGNVCENSHVIVEKTRMTRLHRAKTNLTRSKIKHSTKVPFIEPTVENESQNAKYLQQDRCGCLRCIIMRQKYTDQDPVMSAHNYPCQNYPCHNLQLLDIATITKSSHMS